jgi:hypothetical protein
VSESGAFTKLYRSVGRTSRVAGIGFAVLSVDLLVLSVRTGFVVFEIDSVIAFLAAVVLLFKDPRARAQARVLDAVLVSSDQLTQELSEYAGLEFTYVPTGKGVDEVVVLPARIQDIDIPNGVKSAAELTPPGLGLAQLFVREVGKQRLTLDVIRASLPQIITGNFGLASSVEVDVEQDQFVAVLRGAAATCTCDSGQADSGGWIGCSVASFLAVLVAHATGRPLSLRKCVHDLAADSWKISIDLGPAAEEA